MPVWLRVLAGLLALAALFAAVSLVSSARAHGIADLPALLMSGAQVIFDVCMGGLFAYVAVTGLAAIVAYKYFVTGFAEGAGLEGLQAHMWHERVTLSNLFLLLVGFAVLSRQFEDSKAPDAMPALLPDNWMGGLALLSMVLVLSSFLDNIAAALIGGVVARHVYHGKVHIAYLAGIVAASNAGGAGSVVGDTTTTMMWIDGVSPLNVVHAFIGSAVAFLVFSIPISIVQQMHQPIQKHREGEFKIDWTRVSVVAIILITAISANVCANLFAPELLDQYPVIGIGVWSAIIVTAVIRKPLFAVIPGQLKGALFLLSLVTCASLMPVERLPEASWQVALGLGFVSSVFDNIPLTALALNQGGYDWGVLAYCVGYGGSMIWFGSSAGVALSNQYPEAKSAVRWLLHGWWVVLGYVAGFFALLYVMGWHPHAPHKAYPTAVPHASPVGDPATASP